MEYTEAVKCSDVLKFTETHQIIQRVSFLKTETNKRHPLWMSLFYKQDSLASQTTKGRRRKHLDYDSEFCQILGWSVPGSLCFPTRTQQTRSAAYVVGRYGNATFQNTCKL